MNTSSFQQKARWGLLVLTLINLLNYLDRYVVSALVESLKRSELALTDTQAGLLMTSFVVVYMLASPFFGVLGDRISRPKLLTLGVAIWSVATFVAGFAQSFFFLFAARAVVGIGEAAYGTIAPALLSDYYPPQKRGRAFSFFYSAIPIGAALGYVLGGAIDQRYGWRMAFFVAGIPGILLSLGCLKLFDPPRGIQDNETAPSTNKGFRTYLKLFENTTYRNTIFGYAAYTFAVGGLAFWMPAFLERVRGLSKSEATVSFGLIILITGFVGTFSGGWLGDYFLKKRKDAYLWVSGMATLLAAPFVWVALTAHQPSLFYSSIVIAQLLLFISTGPINSTISNVVSPHMRACAFAGSNLAIHILGDVPSPPLIGWLSDGITLGKAVLVIPGVIFISGMIWLLTARKSVKI